jgi:hypothetical protein
MNKKLLLLINLILFLNFVSASEKKCSPSYPQVTKASRSENYKELPINHSAITIASASTRIIPSSESLPKNVYSPKLSSKNHTPYAQGSIMGGSN